MLSPGRVDDFLDTLNYGRTLEVRAETGSTNDDARHAADAGMPNGHTIVAGSQTAGRGTHGRTWSSPPDMDLYFSVVARLSADVGAMASVTLAVGLGVALAAERLAGKPAEIKWPNDVRLAGKKCAGILVETTSVDGAAAAPAILGVGLNVNRVEWPTELGHIATSLAQVSGKDFEREEVLALALGEIEKAVNLWTAEGPAAVVEQLHPRLAWRGQRVRCGPIEGTLIGIAQSGCALVDVGGARQELASGRLELA